MATTTPPSSWWTLTIIAFSIFSASSALQSHLDEIYPDIESNEEESYHPDPATLKSGSATEPRLPEAPTFIETTTTIAVEEPRMPPPKLETENTSPSSKQSDSRTKSKTIEIRPEQHQLLKHPTQTGLLQTHTKTTPFKATLNATGDLPKDAKAKNASFNLPFKGNREHKPKPVVRLNTTPSPEDDYVLPDHSSSSADTSMISGTKRLMDTNDMTQHDMNYKKQPNKVTSSEANIAVTWVPSAVEDCTNPRGPLRPISAGSKYFADRINMYTYSEAEATCKKFQLTVADLDSIIDHRIIASYIIHHYERPYVSGPNETKFWTGMNDRNDEGFFVRGNNKTLNFQSFHTSQPDDGNKAEDCTTIGKEYLDGPVGQFDDNCNMTAHLLCMFDSNSLCLPRASESIENVELKKKKGLTLLINVTRRAFFVSNFQVSFGSAHKYCRIHKMYLFDMNDLVALDFFFKLRDWENEFINASIPIVQYWSTNQFKTSHRVPEVLWHSQSMQTTWDDARDNNIFSFTKIFKWSRIKKANPGGLYNYQRDMCISLALEMKPDPLPFVRNSNCDIPNYFVCIQDYAWKKSEKDDPTDRKKRGWFNIKRRI